MYQNIQNPHYRTDRFRREGKILDGDKA